MRGRKESRAAGEAPQEGEGHRNGRDVVVHVATPLHFAAVDGCVYDSTAAGAADRTRRATPTGAGCLAAYLSACRSIYLSVCLSQSVSARLSRHVAVRGVGGTDRNKDGEAFARH